MNVTVVVTPKLRGSTARAVELLKKIEYDSLFLPLSRALEKYIAELVEGIPYEYVLSRLRRSGLISEPFGAWECIAEPLLKKLPQIKRCNEDLQTYCYGDQLYDKISSDNAVEGTILTLRSCVSGRIDVKKWRELIQHDTYQGVEALHREADFVASKIERHKNSVCISGLNGRQIAGQLEEEGYKAKVKELDLPYYQTPLETLKNEARREIADERIEKLVRYHIEYIRRYVLKSRNSDEAYRKWVHQEAERRRLPAVI